MKKMLIMCLYLVVSVVGLCTTVRGPINSSKDIDLSVAIHKLEKNYDAQLEGYVLRSLGSLEIGDQLGLLYRINPVTTLLTLLIVIGIIGVVMYNNTIGRKTIIVLGVFFSALVIILFGVGLAQIILYISINTFWYYMIMLFFLCILYAALTVINKPVQILEYQEPFIKR